MSVESDRELLRRFEPVVRYTKGERFLPLRVEPYVSVCSLWKQGENEEPARVVPEGELTLERLSETRHDASGARYFLKFIDPLNVAELAAYKVKRRRAERKEGKEKQFRAGRGRLARVGYVPRFLDVLFSLTLLVRGRVSGDTAAAAVIAHEHMEGKDEHVYYGRVVRQDGWIALQYWFFHAFNDWRSGFFGVNDHEADWEMACIYLYEDEGELVPEWAAYSSHDFSGDDLRRRWDDPELHKENGHPVVYSAAGSHASYFAPGEYLTELEIPVLSPVARALGTARKLWRRMLRQYRGESNGTPGHVFSFAFVDYARGDGFSIGPGAEVEWDDAVVIDPPPAWISGYRGLWGLYARDPVAGEDAPAGPMFNRDGTARLAWRDPIGWAGLDKEAPPNRAREYVSRRRVHLEEDCARLEEEAAEKSRALSGLGVEARAMGDAFHLKKQRQEHEKKIAEISAELEEARVGLAADRALAEALEKKERDLAKGDKGPARSHIKHAHKPASDTELRFDRVAEAWAAVSIALSMVVLVGLILFAREYLVFGLVALVALLVFVESGFRKRLTELTTSVTVGLATVAAVILVYEFFWQAVVASVLAAAAYMLWENVRELRT
jgi:hypothetical protein